MRKIFWIKLGAPSRPSSCSYVSLSAMSLFSRNEKDLPGISGTVRDGSRLERALKRMGEGDIVVIDAPDISRPLAQQLIDAKVAAVVNTGAFTTGFVPNYGPQMMRDADIEMVQNVGDEVFEKLKDGKNGRLDDGKLYHGDRLIGQGDEVDQDELERAFDEGRTSMVDRLEALSGNLVEFAKTESPLYIDGLGIPDETEPLHGRKVVVVSPGEGHRKTLEDLKNFIREYEPLLIGVDAGADTLFDLKYEPDYIIGDPENINSEALRSAGCVILPADPDGHAVGLERIQDLGIGAMTFPALSDSATDLALVFAAHHEADMVVSVGAPQNIDSIYHAENQSGVPSALLSRLKVGEKLVDGRMVADLYQVNSRGFGVAWAILAIFVAVAVIFAIAGTSGDGSVSENLIDTWNSIALWFQGLFK